ncbi:hypothetical protein PHISCL_01460 [Aspergillus sclerotialis]|uniref:Zn(2)-C6 fungal-type domain-containing protein n=1 Tax=Aspergillus sclerotialis TaxID=2070753 RepID=A0A3A2ZST4_9EURO|nr:hypothetical protein PHISCL_01460 [Aspergillus sclerotialis]
MQASTAVNRTETPRRTRTQTRIRRSRRIKTFTGCMTCRSRHLKCDEQRPACRRCVDAQVECSGYPGYRATVQWKPVRGPSDFGSGQITPLASDDWDPSRAQQTSPEHSHGSLVLSDLVTNPQRTSPTAPFEAAFSQPEPTSTHASPRILIGQQDSVSPANRSLSHLSPLSGQPRQPYDASEPISFAQDGDRSRSSAVYSAPGPVPSLECFGFSQQSSEAERHIDRAPSMHLQRRCIEHWINHLSDALSSVPGSKNPLKRFFVPIAFAGAMSSASSSTGSVALFYLICSASAFHLSVHSADSKESSDYMTLALSHQNQGIRHLQHNLVKDDPDERESVLASLLMCLTYEPVTVERNFWLTHLRGASQWLQKADISLWARTESAVIMYQMLSSTATMLRSQILSEDVAQESNFHFGLNAMLEPYHLHHIFGLPERCFELVSQMVEMAVRLRQHSPTITVDLDRLETELYLSIPPECQVPAATRGQDDLVHHYSQIFYFSSIIYCKRRLKGMPLSDVQPLVEQACDHIEALANYRSRPYSPILWPVAVALFEVQDIALRRRALDWLDFIIEQSTLSIWQKFKPLLCSLWEKREIPGQEELQWDDFLSDPTTPSIMIV